MKDRIIWIDLAKGFCILLVVLSHVADYIYIDVPFSEQMSSFRMPLYFVLSGMFFKQYDGFVGFFKRKANKLLVPFLFFLITTSVIPYAIVNQENSLNLFFTEENGPVYNFAIWFLLCLFEINILFYAIQILSFKLTTEYRFTFVLVVSVLLGCFGIFLGVNDCRLPFYIGTAFTAMPFFAFGWWLRNNTSFLSSPVSPVLDVSIIVFCSLIVYFCADRVIYSSNIIPINSFALVHLCGIAGTMMVLIIAKFLKTLPLVSFWGRYSIIILCTHQIVIIIVQHFIKSVFVGSLLFLMLFLLTVIICHILILFMKRFMPHVTAQKDLIRI